MFVANNREKQFQVVLLASILFLLMWSLAACGDSSQANPTSGKSSQSKDTSQPSMPRITIVAKDYSFDMPETLPAGLVDITLSNRGTEAHQATLARLNEGVTRDQVLTAATKNPGETLHLLTSVGGPGAIEANRSQEVILTLSPGQYLVACFVHSPDHQYHTAKGMMKFIQVDSPSNPGQVSQPVAQGKVIFKDFRFVLPASLKAEPILLNMTNEGAEPHQVSFLKLAPGKTVQDALHFLDQLSGPAPFERAGGMSALTTGQSGWVKLDLEPGNYAALCLVPDSITMQPHSKRGMVSTFTVQES